MTAKSRATLNSDADTNLATNGAGDITAEDVRTIVKDLADSAVLIADFTTRGDILIRDATTVVRLPIGSSGKVLSSDGTDVSWQTPASGDVAGDIHAATGKTTPVDADELGIVDSAASNVLKKLTWANLKATAKTYFDTLYQPLNSVLTAFVGLSPSNDDFLQRKSGAWANRTVAQVLTDLAAAGTTFQPLDSDLTAIAALSPSNDDIVQRKAGAWTNRTIAQLLTDLAAAGTTFQPLDSGLTALAAFNTNGILVQTANNTFAGRTLTGTAAQITVTNGDGVSGNPTLSLPSDVLIPTVLTVPNTGLHILDTNASHDLIIAPGSNITADRTLTVTTGDADRTVTISGNATISQDYSTTGTPQFAAIELGAASDTTISRSSAGHIAVEGSNVVLASDEASTSDYRGNTADKYLTTDIVFSSMAFVGLSDASSITWDMDTGFNFSVSLGGNRTLANPSNVEVGKAGCVKFTASGAIRTIDFGTNFYSDSSLTLPISIASGADCYVFYFAQASSVILITGVLNGPA